MDKKFDGMKLRKCRRDLNLTQSQLSEKSGLSRVCIAMLERGKTTPHANTIGALSAVLGCSTEDFFSDREQA